MINENPIVGYGFSPEGLLSAHSREDQDSDGGCTDDCPLTWILLQFVLGYLAAAETSQVQTHLDSGCEPCRRRVASQKRAAQSASELERGPTGLELVKPLLVAAHEKARVWSGELREVSLPGCTGIDEPLVFETLNTDDRLETTKIYCRWKLISPRTNLWKVGLRIPSSQASNGLHNPSANQLRQLEGFYVDVALKRNQAADPEVSFRTRLDWDHDEPQLVTAPTPVVCVQPRELKIFNWRECDERMTLDLS